LLGGAANLNLASNAYDVVADASYVYSTNGTSISRTPLAGGAMLSFYTDPAPGGDAFLADAGNELVLLQQTALYTSTILVVSKATGAATELAKTGASRGLAVDSGRAIWVEEDGKCSLRAVSLSAGPGGAPVTLASSKLLCQGSKYGKPLVVHAGSAFFSDGSRILHIILPPP
jgi:hypothetical protein